MKEEWKDYPEFDYIQVSNMGNIRTKEGYIRGKSNSFRFIKGKPLNQRNNKKGYPEIVICRNRINASPRAVHKLVMLSFKGERPKGMQINHINGVKTDNRLENLEWITPSENVKHAYKIGLSSRKGEFNTKAKLNKEKVNIIREKYSSNKFTQKELGLEFKVTQSTISSIIKCTTWFS